MQATARMTALVLCGLAVPLTSGVAFLSLDEWRPYADDCVASPAGQQPAPGIDWLPWPRVTCWDQEGSRSEHPLTPTVLLPVAALLLGAAVAAAEPTRRG